VTESEFDYSAFARLIDLVPMPAYVTNRDGTIRWWNSRLRAMLDVEVNDHGTRNIRDFYARPEEREDLVATTETANELKRVISLKTAGGHPVQAQLFCRPLRNSRNETVGFFGTLIEASETGYHHLFEKYISTGLYTLDAEDNVLTANDRFALLHGYDSASEIIGKNVRLFYARPAEAQSIRNKIITAGILVREIVELRKKSGQTFLAYVTAIPLMMKGAYAGRGGLIEDRTAEIEYETLLDEAPVGVYSTETRDDADIVTKCNRTFAELHEYDSPEQMINVDIRKAHASEEESRKYLEALKDAAAKNRPVVGYKLNIKTRKGNLKTIEINSQPKMRDGKLIGRTGVIRDITEELSLRAEVSSLAHDIRVVTNDVDAVIHVFRQTLTQMSLLAQSVEGFLGRSNDLGIPPTDLELEANVKGPLHETISGVRVIATQLAASDAFRGERVRLLELASLLEAYRKLERPQWRDAWLEGVVEILSLVDRVAPRAVARSIYRPTVVAAEQVGRLTSLATLQIARDAIVAVDTPVAALREFISSGKRVPEPKKRSRLQDLVTDAIRNLSAFATMRRVRVEFDGTGTAFVHAQRGAVTRAIGNVIHNAIKYSWSRDDLQAWIKVLISTDSLSATVRIENWGVPIPAEEIDKGLVFELGYRGRLSADRGRPGTGVGLTDSLRVAKEHDGTVSVESRAARTGGSATDYDQPFITIVSLRLALTPRDAKVRT
jgi:PAS domain S-box-containing protein